MDFSGFTVREVPNQWLRFIDYIKIKKRSGNNVNNSPETNKSWLSKITSLITKLLHDFLNLIQQNYGILNNVRIPEPLALWANPAYQSVCNENWDIVVSTAGPYYVHFPAYRLRKSGLAKYWIADWRDLWVDNHIYPGIPILKTIERWQERKWCKTADCVTTVSEPLAEILRNNYQCRVEVIYNGFDVEDYESLPTENAFNDHGVFRILYTGTIYHKTQDPSPLFDAIKRLNDAGVICPDQLKILFCGFNSNVNSIADNYEVSDYVEDLGFVPRKKALHMQRDADALLLLEVETDKAKGVLTGKLFEYLFAGPPILAIGVGADSSVGAVLSNTGRGIAYGRDICKIKEGLCLLLSKKSLKNENQVNSLGVMIYTREIQANKMMQLINEIMK